MRNTPELRNAVQELISYVHENTPYGCMNQPSTDEEWAEENKEINASKVIYEELYGDKDHGLKMAELLTRNEAGPIEMSLKESIQYFIDKIEEDFEEPDVESPWHDDIKNNIKVVRTEMLLND